MQENAAELSDLLEKHVDFVRERTRDIPDSEKPDVLVFGPSPSARKKGGAGQVFGLDTIESSFIEDVVNARNAYRQPGYFMIVSPEHLLAIAPDIIVLCTAAGYHPPRELYDSPCYENLSTISAVKNRRVSTLPWTPWNCAKRLEYPIDIMAIATAAYPELFSDIDLGQWLLDFYSEVYSVDKQTAKKNPLRPVDGLDSRKQ